MAELLLRRSPHLVFYWEREELIVNNYLFRTKVAVKPAVMELLHYCARPRKVQQLQRAFPQYPSRWLLPAIQDLLSWCLLEPVTKSTQELENAMRHWDRWGLEARFFHWSTRDAPYPGPEGMAERDKERLKCSPSPAAFKRYSRSARIELPPVQKDSSAKFTDVLLARRTLRDFDGSAISLLELATLLKLTWGVTGWASSNPFGRMPLKTSPSGGARHPIEVYVAVHNVQGLRQGLYHYSPDRHLLHVIRFGNVKRRAKLYCAKQWWTKDAAALFFMTAIFERTMWRYEYSRALRTIYMEAGHLCQTFYLTATALKLAPFCTAAIADSLIEKDLRLDGIRESVLYVTAAGHVR